MGWAGMGAEPPWTEGPGPCKVCIFMYSMCIHIYVYLYIYMHIYTYIYICDCVFYVQLYMYIYIYMDRYITNQTHVVCFLSLGPWSLVSLRQHSWPKPTLRCCHWAQTAGYLRHFMPPTLENQWPWLSNEPLALKWHPSIAAPSECSPFSALALQPFDQFLLALVLARVLQTMTDKNTKVFLKCKQHMNTHGIDARHGQVTFHVYLFGYVFPR